MADPQGQGEAAQDAQMNGKGSGLISDSFEPPGPRKEGEYRMPTPDEMMAQDMFNNCAVRTVFSGVMGGGMGVLMGALFGGLDAPIDGLKFRQSVAVMAKSTGSRAWHMAKAFAVMGALFSGSECMVEKFRAKHDSTNTVVAGCVTGGALSARAGPQAACMGCAGFAAFSVVIEKVMERYH